jgi:hypothetical protein
MRLTTFSPDGLSSPTGTFGRLSKDSRRTSPDPSIADAVERKINEKIDKKVDDVVQIARDPAAHLKKPTTWAGPLQREGELLAKSPKAGARALGGAFRTASTIIQAREKLKELTEGPQLGLRPAGNDPWSVRPAPPLVNR